MCDDVLVDLHMVCGWATRLVRGSASSDDLEIIPSGVDAIDLLPGWYDDWALIERERVRQRLLHALEALSRQLAQTGRCAEAVDAAMMAVAAESLRESAQRVAAAVPRSGAALDLLRADSARQVPTPRLHRRPPTPPVPPIAVNVTDRSAPRTPNRIIRARSRK
jgi:hypothetical protein